MFRNQGGFSSCSTGTCPNYFPEDPFIGGRYGQGYNPGNIGGNGFNNQGNYGSSGFNPGNPGGQEFIPGGIVGGSGFNPGENTYNPGDQWGYNPGNDNLVEVGNTVPVQDGNWDNPGEDWYNPGTSGYNTGAGGYNPDGNNYELGSGGFGEAGYVPGNTGYNPGNMAGGQGFTPVAGRRSQGYNSGLRSSTAEGEETSLLIDTKETSMETLVS